MRLKELMRRYLEYLKFEKNKSESTLKSYTRYLTNFYKFTGNIKTKKITYDLVRSFITQKGREEYDPNYINSIVMALRSFLRYANTHNIPCVSFLMIELGNRVNRNIVFLEKDELKKLLATPDEKTIKGLRDRAILELLISTGMRVGELIGLKRNQVNKSNCISVNGKGNKLRPVFISKRAKRWLNKYLKTRKDDSPALFCRNKNAKLY
jgi:integrase/recombinase XerD